MVQNGSFAGPTFTTFQAIAVSRTSASTYVTATCQYVIIGIGS
jgi:hypothetical protein